MTANRDSVIQFDHLATEPESWDDALLGAGGHLLQSWRWAAFKERFGWSVARVAVPAMGGVAQAQILFRQRAGVSVGYIPRGPVVLVDDPAAASALWAQIDRVARLRRALTIIVESNAAMPELSGDFRLFPGPAPIQPSRTVKVDLGDDEALMAQMHAKTRYNVRLALRREVATRFVQPTSAWVGTFYDMLADTSSRNDFEIHSPEYYGVFLKLFGDDAALVFAEIEGRPVCGAIAVAFGDEAIYMYGASSSKERAHGAGFLIQYDIMRWARDRGCRRYDLWGIPADDPDSSRAESGDRLAASSGSDRRGLYEFKTRFGGQIVTYPPPMERRYHPVLATLARRFYRTGGSG